MDLVMNDQRSKIHPHKFTLWVAIGSIIMMFAGLTSAVIIKSNQANWQTFILSPYFWYSTAVLLFSSLAMRLSQKYFGLKEMPRYRQWLLVTTVSGLLFVTLQFLGFRELWLNGITLQKNVAFSFLYVIVGLHAVHVIAGLIALLIIYLKAFNTKVRIYSSVPIDMMATYWYFVDILWIYLLIFLVIIK